MPLSNVEVTFRSLVAIMRRGLQTVRYIFFQGTNDSNGYFGKDFPNEKPACCFWKESAIITIPRNTARHENYLKAMMSMNLRIRSWKYLNIVYTYQVPVIFYDKIVFILI